MNQLTDYSLFEPVFPFSINFREMKHPEAQLYFDWFLQQIPSRLNLLRGALNMDVDTFTLSQENLTLLGGVLDDNISVHDLTASEVGDEQAKSPEWFRQSVPTKVLSDKTISLCVDIGIFFAEVLRSKHQRLIWTYPSKPKNDANYHQPVLAGFGNHVQLNPVRVASVVAYKTMDGHRAQEELPRVFGVWDHMA